MPCRVHRRLPCTTTSYLITHTAADGRLISSRFVPPAWEHSDAQHVFPRPSTRLETTPQAPNDPEPPIPSFPCGFHAYAMSRDPPWALLAIPILGWRTAEVAEHPVSVHKQQYQGDLFVCSIILPQFFPHGCSIQQSHHLQRVSDYERWGPIAMER